MPSLPAEASCACLPAVPSLPLIPPKKKATQCNTMQTDRWQLLTTFAERERRREGGGGERGGEGRGQVSPAENVPTRGPLHSPRRSLHCRGEYWTLRPRVLCCCCAVQKSHISKKLGLIRRGVKLSAGCY